jgi:hypothetical protein
LKLVFSLFPPRALRTPRLISLSGTTPPAANKWNLKQAQVDKGLKKQILTILLSCQENATNAIEKSEL